MHILFIYFCDDWRVCMYVSVCMSKHNMNFTCRIVVVCHMNNLYIGGTDMISFTVYTNSWKEWKTKKKRMIQLWCVCVLGTDVYVTVVEGDEKTIFNKYKFRSNQNSLRNVCSVYFSMSDWLSFCTYVRWCYETCGKVLINPAFFLSKYFCFALPESPTCRRTVTHVYVKASTKVFLTEFWNSFRPKSKFYRFVYTSHF